MSWFTLPYSFVFLEKEYYLRKTQFYDLQRPRFICFVTFSVLCKEKPKSSPKNSLRRPKGGIELYLYSFFNLSVRWGRLSTSHPGCFTLEKDPVPIVWEAGLATGTVWIGAEILTPPPPPPGFDPRTVQPVASRYTD
jgi:hypothetical protein